MRWPVTRPRDSGAQGPRLLGALHTLDAPHHQAVTEGGPSFASSGSPASKHGGTNGNSGIYARLLFPVLSHEKPFCKNGD